MIGGGPDLCGGNADIGGTLNFNGAGVAFGGFDDSSGDSEASGYSNEELEAAEGTVCAGGAGEVGTGVGDSLFDGGVGGSSESLVVWGAGEEEELPEGGGGGGALFFLLDVELEIVISVGVGAETMG